MAHPDRDTVLEASPAALEVMDRLSVAGGPLAVLGAQVPIIAIVHLLGI